MPCGGQLDGVNRQLAALPHLSARQQARVRAEVALALLALEHGLELAREALEGPDPESAIGYLAVAAASCEEALGATLASLAN
jgi:hypothetical protein